MMDKPWSESCGPVTASERDVQKAGAINALLVRPIDVLPQKAGDPIRPLAVGIFSEIRALLKPDVGVTKLRRATAIYVRLKRYYFASAQPDSMRHDLAGAPVEPVSAADRLEAQRRFLEMKRTRMQPDALAAVPHVAADPEPTKNDLIRAALLKRRSLTTK
jgi:sRNA-binding protein